MFVSAVAVWEVAIKQSLGKLSAIPNLLDVVEESGFASLPVTLRHGVAAGALPLHHRDPFDRMLIAQAQIEELTIVTHDRAFADYDVAVLPA